jgi:hypothetical protein
VSALAPLNSDIWQQLATGPSTELLEQLQLADGLPVAPLEAGAVDEALRVAGLRPDDIVTAMPPLLRPASAESLAACALLAGCEPRVFPVVVAAVLAIADGAFNGVGVLTTTGTAAIAVVVSGGATALFNSGANLLGPGNRGNATVGRAISLISRSIGGAVPGIGDMSTMGQPGKYTFCFAESADSPWDPTHVDAGLREDESAVTVFAASGTTEVTNAYITDADDVLDTLAAGLYFPGTINFDLGLTGGGRYIVLISPDWAQMLADAGFSRGAVAEELVTRATWPVTILPAGLRRPLAPTHADGSIMDMLRAAASPDDLTLVVCGGVGTKQTVIPCWAGGSRPVTKPIMASRLA